MAVVDEGEPPPDELRLAWDCKRWDTLPDAGGLYDQDAYLMHAMTTLTNVYDTLSRARGLEGAQIHTLSRGERKLIKWLRDEGMM